MGRRSCFFVFLPEGQSAVTDQVVAERRRMAAMGSSKRIDQLGAAAASALVALEAMCGENAEETRLLQGMAEAAREYLASYTWCRQIQETYFGGGVGGIFAVFLFRIRAGRSEIDPWIWVMTGNVPPAFLPISDCGSPAQAFAMYLVGMGKWAALARLGKSGSPEEGVPPVDAAPTPERGEDLQRRLFSLEALLGKHFGIPGAGSATIQ